MAGSTTATYIAAAGLALSAVGTGVGMIGQMQQASAQKAAADYSAKVAENNAIIAQQNAVRASQAGEQQAAMQQMKTRAAVGAMAAGQGASGVDVGSGSFGSVKESTTKLGMLDALTIRSNAARQAYGYETQATNFDNQATIDTATGENAQTAGYIGMGGGLLSGVGNAADRYGNFLNKGMNAGGTPGTNFMQTAQPLTDTQWNDFLSKPQ